MEGPRGGWVTDSSFLCACGLGSRQRTETVLDPSSGADFVLTSPKILGILSVLNRWGIVQREDNGL